ncbi:hypothetical protein D3C81_869760 [compost metagenome]
MTPGAHREMPALRDRHGAHHADQQCPCDRWRRIHRQPPRLPPCRRGLRLRGAAQPRHQSRQPHRARAHPGGHAPCRACPAPVAAAARGGVRAGPGRCRRAGRRHRLGRHGWHCGQSRWRAAWRPGRPIWPPVRRRACGPAAPDRGFLPAHRRSPADPHERARRGPAGAVDVPAQQGRGRARGARERARLDRHAAVGGVRAGRPLPEPVRPDAADGAGGAAGLRPGALPAGVRDGCGGGFPARDGQSGHGGPGLRGGRAAGLYARGAGALRGAGVGPSAPGDRAA